MGNVLKQLQDNRVMLTQFIWLRDITISNIREYYASFRSICDTFAIDQDEYQQIFNIKDPQQFDQWLQQDDDQLIDALDLFSGLILFSKDYFNEKVKFLFSIFDFNEMNSLSHQDIEFLLTSCVNAIYKAYYIDEDVPEEDIKDMISDIRDSEKRLNIIQVIEWFQKKDIIQEICTELQILTLKQDGQDILVNNQVDKQENSINNINQNQNNNFINQGSQNNNINNNDNDKQNPIKISQQNNLSSGPVKIQHKDFDFQKYQSNLFFSKKYQQQLEWLGNIQSRLKVNPQNINQMNLNSKQNQDIKIDINWVYGFNCEQHVKQPISIVYDKNLDYSKLLYFTSNIVIIYDPVKKKQTHYTEHENEIQSISVSQYQQYVATGEKANQPGIHIWESDTLQNVGIIKGIHQNGIQFLTFFNKDELLASCSYKEFSPLLVYSTITLELIFSTSQEDQVIQFGIIHNYLGQVFNKKDLEQFQENKLKVHQNRGYQLLVDTNIPNDQNYKRAINTEEVFENYENCLIVVMKNTLYFYFNGQIFNSYGLQLDENSGLIDGELTCALVMRLNSEEPYLKIYEQEDQGRIVIVLGTSIGIVYHFQWPESERIQPFPQQYNSKIIDIKSYEKGIIIATGKGSLHLWDLTFTQNLYNVNLTELPSTLKNYNIQYLLNLPKEFLICTEAGDILTIKKDFKHQINQNNHNYIIQNSRENALIKLQKEQNNICLVEKEEEEENLIYIVSKQSTIIGISQKQHQIVDIWNVGGNIEIQIMECHYQMDQGITFALGYKQGNKYFLAVKYNKEQNIQKLEVSDNFIFIKFSKDGQYMFVTTQDGMFYIHTYYKGTYFNGLMQTMPFENEIPICLEFQSDQVFIPQNMQQQQVQQNPNILPNPNLMQYVNQQNNLQQLNANNQQNQYQKDQYVVPDSKSCELSLILLTSNRNIFQINLPLKENKNRKLVQEHQKIRIPFWKLKYPTSKALGVSSCIPVILGEESRILLSGNDKGVINFWKDVQELKDNCGGFLHQHIGKVVDILLNKSQTKFYSMGQFDSTVIEWGISQNNDQQNFTKPQKENQQPIPKSLEKQVFLRDEALIREQDYGLYKAIEDSSINQIYEKGTIIKDQYVLFGGTNKKILNSHLYEIFESQDTGISWQQQEENEVLKKRAPPLSIELDYVYGFQSYDVRQGLKYCHIYCEDEDDKLKRGLIKKSTKKQYNKKQILKKLSKHKDFLDQQNKNEKILSVQKVCQDFHKNCQSFIIYFVSRIVILLNPNNNKQRYYQNHAKKITCICLHPLKNIVASAEAGLKPTIHIWNAINCEGINILQTFHKNGILKIQFSNDAKFIISIGCIPPFSIQVQNWKNGETIAQRNTGMLNIFDIQFNPYNRYQFATCGVQYITIWDIKQKNIFRTYNIDVAEESFHSNNCCITCLSYIPYSLNQEKTVDILVGNNFGELIVVTEGKYIVVAKAHQKMINCIKGVNLFLNNKYVIITSGEDDTIKFWNTEFQQINNIAISSISVKQQNIYKHFQDANNKSDKRNYSASSIDVFYCKPSQQLQRKQKNSVNQYQNQAQQQQQISNYNWPKILIGTRYGDIIEATIYKLDTTIQRNIPQKSNDQYFNYSSDESSEEEEINDYDGDSDNGFKFEYNLILRSHSSQKFNQNPNTSTKKVIFALHPTSNLMITIGEDQNMCTYDITTNKLLSIQYLQIKPTAIKFSPEGDLLVLGLQNGKVLIYESKLKKAQFGQGGRQEFPQFSKSLAQELKEGNTPVINFEFSLKGDLLAVSYDYSRSSKEFEGNLEKEGSYISIYTNRASHKSAKSRGQEKLLYSHYIYITPPSSYESNDSSGYGLACYFMTFSKDSEIDYLQIYYQQVDNNLVRINNDSQGAFLIWDLNNNIAVKSQENIKKISWKQFNFANSLIAKHVLHNQIGYTEEQIKTKDLHLWQSQILQMGLKMNLNKHYIQPVNQNNKNGTFLTQSQMLDLRASQILRSQNLMITGSIDGNIHFVKNTCLGGKKDFNINNIQDEQMGLAKSYSSHISFVNQIEISQNQMHTRDTDRYLFTSGITDECILKWKLVLEDHYWDYDNSVYKFDVKQQVALLGKIEDDYIDIKKFLNQETKIITNLNQAYFEIYLKSNQLQLRNQIKEYELQQRQIIKQQNQQQSPITLQLKKIIGRSSFSRSNNLMYDHEEKIIYIAGSNLIITNPRKEELIDNMEELESDEDDSEYQYGYEIEQKIIKLDEFPGTIYPEIGCFDLCQNLKFLVAGTIQIDAKLLIWDIASRTPLKDIVLQGTTAIQNVKFAYDNRHVVCLALNSNYQAVIYLIDTLLPVILGCVHFPHSSPFKIKDIAFLPNSYNKFITCGQQYMTLWSYSGEILSYQAMEIENPKDIEDQIKKQNQPDFEKIEEEDNMEEKDDDKIDDENEEDIGKELLRVVFLCLIFVQDIIITGGDDGFLYIWEDKQIKQKHMAQKKLMITTLSAKKNENIFVSGTENGYIQLWKIRKVDSNFLIDKIADYSLPKVEGLDSHTIVQSLCIGNQYILVGTKTGDIYEVALPQKKQKTFNKVFVRITANDDQIPCFLSFSQIQNKLYSISKNGLFAVWDILTFQKIYSKYFERQTFGLIVCRDSPRIFIGFYSDIFILKPEENNVYKVDPSLKIDCQQQITDMKISQNEQMLAIALAPNQNSQAKVFIYNINPDLPQFELSCQIENLPMVIEYIDFTKDNLYLIYKEKDNSDLTTAVNYIDLKNLRKINALFIEQGVEWVSDGVKVQEHSKGILEHYLDDNPIHKMVLIGDHCAVVTDEMGSVRVFRWPVEENSTCDQVQFDHLNQINQCVVCPQNKYLATCSTSDKCIFIWEIIQKENLFLIEDEEADQDADNNSQNTENQQKFNIQQSQHLNQSQIQQQQQSHFYNQ